MADLAGDDRTGIGPEGTPRLGSNRRIAFSSPTTPSWTRSSTWSGCAACLRASVTDEPEVPGHERVERVGIVVLAHGGDEPRVAARSARRGWVRAAGMCRRPVPSVTAFPSRPPFSARLARLRSRLPRERHEGEVQRALLLRHGRRVRGLVRAGCRSTPTASGRRRRPWPSPERGVAAVLCGLPGFGLALPQPGSASAADARRACSSHQPAVASPVVASPPTPFCDCSFDWPRVVRVSRPTRRPSCSCSTARRRPSGSAGRRRPARSAFTGAVWYAFDVAVASCDVAVRSWTPTATDSHVAAVGVAARRIAREPQQPPEPVVASPVEASPP